MAGSLDDNPPRLFDNNVDYLVLGRPGKTRILVSTEAVMPRDIIANQLRDLADYLDTLDDCDCDDQDDQ